MQLSTIQPVSVLHQIRCDRCGKEVERGEVDFAHMTSIGFDAGYDSIFGDGNRVEVDLCEACLRDTLGNWLRVKSPEDTRLAGMLAAFKPAVHGGEFPAPPMDDPIEPLSAQKLGQVLGGLSEEAVWQRERAGELFSVLRPGSKRGREYPAFQTWTGLAGQPLTMVLAALSPTSGTVAYGFFASPTDLLGGLTPIEAILGRLTMPRDVEADTQDFLATAPEERLQAVVKAAKAYAAAQAA